MNWFKKIKEFLEFPSHYQDYFSVCLDCGSVFEKKRIEVFIKHQIDKKHYNASRINKTDNFTIDFIVLTNMFIIRHN